MRASLSLIAIGLLAAVQAGCHNEPAPPRVPVPAPTYGEPAVRYEHERMKPLPRERVGQDYPPPYQDEPLVSQRPPEETSFIDAYRRVNQPRIAVYVNRTLEGEIIPVNEDAPVAAVHHSRRSTTGVTVEKESTYTSDSYYSHGRSERRDKFQSNGPADYNESTEVFLRPGEYDEVQAKSLDYAAIENVLTDWLAAGGQVTIISPTMVRQKLTDEQVKDLQNGRPQVLSEIAKTLGTDVLVQVQAHPTRQTRDGLEVRILAEAMNTAGGESIGRAVVDVPPPLEKTQINRYTRYLARKLMDDMTGSWTAPPPPQRASSTTGPSTTPR